MITEEMMAAAVAEMNEAMLRSLPEPEDCYHEFSAKFEKKMKRVIYRADHPIQFRILQKVASIILVLFLGFATIMAISPTVRASVFGWIREYYQSFISYYFDENLANDNIPTEYHISGLSAEYTELATSESEGSHFTIYTDSHGQILVFAYSLSPEIANFYVDTTEYSLLEVSIAGCSADFYQANDPNNDNCLIWCNSNGNTMFYISAHMSLSELIVLGDSVCPLE